jgi:muramoyltetrapeptide carboxypeptidase
MNKKCKIGIFATSTPVFIETKRYSFLQSKGIEIYEHPQVLKKVGHAAGTKEERINAIYEMLRDPTIDILMAYWGGVNTNELLPFFDYEMFKKYNKPLVGFSDTSALLLAVNKLSGIKTYLGAAGISFDKLDPFEYTYKYFSEMLIEKKSEIVIEDSPTFADDLYFLNPAATHRIINKNFGRKIYNPGKASGKVIASNLQTLLTLAGTKYFPELDEKILFLEEDENANTAFIHRYFTHLSQCCDFKKLKGLCIGRFALSSGFKDTDSEEMIYNDVFKGLNIPIIYNLNFGHTDPLFTIPIGGSAQIDTENNILKFF